MSTTIMEEQLLAALTSERALQDAGCRAARRAGGGVEVSCGSQDLGSWQWTGGRFTFSPTAAGEPERRVETVAEAVRHTIGIARSRS